MMKTTDIPHSSSHEFHACEKPYVLLIGVYNEGEKFTRQLEALQPYRQHVDIVIADGSSDDGATSVAALEGKIRTLLISTGPARGLSVQYRIALCYALEQGYKGVIMMDGNGKDGVDAIPAFIAKLEQGCDFIQGSRFLPGGVHRNTPLIRILGIKLVFNPVVAIATGYRYTDAMNGYKACSRAMLEHPGVQPFRAIFVRYGLQYFFNYIAPRLRLRVCEIPVSRVYRNDKLPHSKIIGYKAYVRILKELLATVTGRYNP